MRGTGKPIRVNYNTGSWWWRCDAQTAYCRWWHGPYASPAAAADAGRGHYRLAHGPSIQIPIAKVAGTWEGVEGLPQSLAQWNEYR